MGGGVLGEAGHSIIRGVATGNYFWFVVHPVAAKCLDGSVPRLSLHFVVTADDKPTFFAR